MATFSYSITQAFILFPFLALLITLPYIFFQYHKYGSLSFYRTILIYAFLLYLLCAYFLVILPLPSVEEVSLMTTPSYNLIPFQFIFEIFHLTSFQISDFATYFPTMQNPVFYESFFNLLLTVPFGMMMRYYFGLSFKKTFFYSFCLSLFFEFTQLTGLYYIYPRSYRVFDVDDLILNTSGGLIGYGLGFLCTKFLPTREEIDQKALKRGESVSFLRRTLAFLLDLTFYLFLSFVSIYFLCQFGVRSRLIFFFLLLFWAILYYIVLTILLRGRTLGMKFLKLTFSSKLNRVYLHQLVGYFFFFWFEYLFFPIILLFLGFVLVRHEVISDALWNYVQIGVFSVTLFIYILSLLKRLFRMPLWYEKMSRLEIVSNIHFQ